MSSTIPERQTCSNCRFSATKPEMGRVGRCCRLHPPQLVMLPFESIRESEQRSWEHPPVGNDDWCGQHSFGYHQLKTYISKEESENG